jgi:hypothetical protein
MPDIDNLIPSAKQIRTEAALKEAEKAEQYARLAAAAEAEVARLGLAHVGADVDGDIRKLLVAPLRFRRGHRSQRLASRRPPGEIEQRHDQYRSQYITGHQ